MAPTRVRHTPAAVPSPTNAPSRRVSAERIQFSFPRTRPTTTPRVKTRPRLRGTIGGDAGKVYRRFANHMGMSVRVVRVLDPQNTTVREVRVSGHINT